MPISPIVVQRRHAELGRIRLGAKEGPKGRPVKLQQFRFTSPSERYIRDLAQLYGGSAQPWDNSGVASWEVYTTATSIPVIAVKGGLSQWMETWSGGGCVHRCDGEQQVDGTTCDPNDWAHQQARPTTRLSVMLPELEAVGVWRVETHGWNAAAEIPAVAELAQFVGDLVPANLHLVERRSVSNGETKRFVVPVLDLQIGTARLREIVQSASGGAPELADTTRRQALEAGDAPSYAPQPAGLPTGRVPAFDYQPFFHMVTDATTLPELAAIWDQARAAKVVGPEAPDSEELATFVSTWKAKAHQIKDAELKAASTQATPGEDPVEAEVVDAGPDADRAWEDVLRAAGKLPEPMTTSQVTADFKDRYGIPASAASAEELVAYRQELEGLVTT